MGKLFVLCLLSVFLLSAATSSAKERSKETAKEIEKILSSAKRDTNGLVTVEEYGRLLAAVLKAKEVHKRVINVLTLAKNYVATLSGPQNPDKLLQELNAGPLWEMIQKETKKGPERKRPVKQEL